MIILSTLTLLGDTGPIGDPFELPCQFMYDQYKPKKRTKTIDTEKGSFRENTLPLIKHGNTTFGWTLEPATPQQVKMLSDMYESGDDFIFTGNLGEEYIVDFIVCERERKCGNWIVKGEFRVVCVNEPANPCHACEPGDAVDPFQIP